MVGAIRPERLGQQVEPFLDVKPPKNSRTNLPASSGYSASRTDRGGQVVERMRDPRRWERSRSASRERAPASGRSRAERGRAGTRPAGGSWPRPAPGRPASSSACAARPRARPCRGRRSGRGRGPCGPPGAPTRVALPETVQCTTSAERTASSRSVSGPRASAPEPSWPCIEPRRRGRHDRDARPAAGQGAGHPQDARAPCRRRAPGPDRCRHAATPASCRTRLRRWSCVAVAGHGLALRSAHEFTSLADGQMRLRVAPCVIDFGPVRVRFQCAAANRSGPQFATISAARRPIAASLIVGTGPPSRPTAWQSFLRRRAGRIAGRSSLRVGHERLGRSRRGRRPAGASRRRRPR